MKERNCEACGSSQYRKEVWRKWGHTTKSGNFVEDKVICRWCGLRYYFDEEGNIKETQILENING
jgi:hypothetical protein